MRHTVLLTALSIIIAAAFSQAKPPDTPAWLVDLGRDYPRTPQAGLSDADAEITLLLMQAASRVNPAMAGAYRWQFDMLTALGRNDAADEALERYVELNPADLAAHLRWIEMRVERLQTTEQRAEFCIAQLRRPNLNPVIASDLHQQLAEFHRNRGETDKAAAEARAAVGAYELNFAARQMLAELIAQNLPKSSREAANLSEELAELASRPGDHMQAWQIADRLALLNLPEPANRLYGHAISLLQISDPWGNLPVVMTARVLTLRALGKSADAETQTKKASEAWQNLLLRSRGLLDPEPMAEMAWFYVFYEPKPVEAEKLARMAVVQAPDLAVGHRALGAALRLLGQIDEAKAELKTVANRDPAAAGEYAQMLATAGDSDGARQTLLAASTRPADPVGNAVLRQATSKLGVATSAPTPADEKIRQVIEKFPWGVLDYPLHPDKYMSLTLEATQSQLPPGDPWLVTAKLRNIGTFPITLGSDMMAASELLISVDTAGDRPRTTGPTIRMSFDKTTVLAVGQSVEVSGTVNLGAVRAGMIGTPQKTQDATVNAVLSPVRVLNQQGQEVWTAGIGGLKAQPLTFRRSTFVPDAKNMADLQRRLQSSDPLDRIAAMELLAMLLAESQHIRAGRLQYAALPIDTPLTQRLILSRTNDVDWQVRARLAECLRWLELDKDATNVAGRMLSDTHWLVRGLTMRALADQYGSKFQTVLAQASKADPDEWVRQFTAALNARITAVTTQPASQPAAGR